jgi:dihydrofolate reductase
LRKIIVSEFLTLDGVMEDPGGSEGTERGGWAFKFNRGPEGDKFKLDELLASDALLLGRTTYQAFASPWPSRTDEFADKMNSMAKYVVSTTLEKAEWNNSHIIKNNVAEEISKLKSQSGKDILIAGSGQLVDLLLQNQLIDEYRLMVFPIILRRGKRLFKDGIASIPLRLLETKPVGSEGVIVITYKQKEKNG